ncbi:MAG: transposase [Pirellulales bacterium]
MSHYLRYFVPGGTFFFTVVTARRSPLFMDSRARRLLGDVTRRCFSKYPLTVIAVVLLPDHLHALWALPAGDARYSLRWSWIKGQFTRQWLSFGGREQPRKGSRSREGRRSVWQRRFWEHTIRNEDDLEAHFDYIHYNPVKHGYVPRPRDWRWSTFHRWVAKGHYNINWGAGITPPSVPGNAGE